MNKTGKAVTADERLRRAQAELDRAAAMPEPTDGQDHGHWIVKRRSCLSHAGHELRAAHRQGASESEIARIEAQIDRVWDATKLRERDDQNQQTR